MTDCAIECTLCDQSFCSEVDFSEHKCTAEQNLELLPVKDEPMDDYEMPEVDCQLADVKEEENDEFESTTVEVDPLAILGDEEYLDNNSESHKDFDQEDCVSNPKEKTKETSSIMSKCLNKYNCKLCGESFAKKDLFTKHFRKDHSSYRPHECPVCKKKFLHKHYVTLHMRVHTGEKPYECPLCPKTYSHKTSYTIHMRIHSGERPYVCSVCGKKCYDKSGLTSHMRSHTKETPYQCEVCGRRFTHSKSLLVHRRNHTGEKPYVCSYCGKAFRHWHKHKIHVRLHTGERPYKCKVCNKGFPRNDEVSRHMKSHSGIKSFKCSICGVYCATQASITGHINLHHENLKEEHDEPPEKTLVQDSKSGILGSKVPEQRSLYRKIHPVPVNKNLPPTITLYPGEQTAMTSSSSGQNATIVPNTSPMKVIEITTKEVDPLSPPLKTKTLQRTLQRSNDKTSSNVCNDTAPLNNVAFMEWQQRMLANQGLVVKGLSESNDSSNISVPKQNSPTILKASNSLGANSAQQKPQYILISQGSGPNITKILLPLSMTGGTTSACTNTSTNSQPMMLMPQPGVCNNGQPMYVMNGDNNKRMFVVAPANQTQKVIQGSEPVNIQMPEPQAAKSLTPINFIKQEPVDNTFLSTTIKTERPSPPSSPLNVNISNLSVNIKAEPE